MPDLRIISGAISPRNLRSAADRLPQIKNYVPRFGHFEKLNTGIKISKNLSVFTGWCFMKCGGRYPLEYRFTSSSGFLNSIRWNITDYKVIDDLTGQSGPD